MSVLVKDMKMPVSCEDCVICDVKWTSDNDGEAWAFCMLKQKTICHTVNGSDKEVATEILKKPDWCPLKEVKHGKWIKADSQQYFRKHYPAFTCSECGQRKDSQKKWNYCPECGADMRGEG